jgi:hypothetical protein
VSRSSNSHASRAESASITASIRSRTVIVSISTSCAAPECPPRASARRIASTSSKIPTSISRSASGCAVESMRDRGEHVAAEQLALADLARDLLEALVLEQPRHELGARVDALVGDRARVRRQQHPRLDPRQRRGHHEVLARDVELELAHQLEVLEVLLGDPRDRDVGDVDLVDA